MDGFDGPRLERMAPIGRVNSLDTRGERCEIGQDTRRPVGSLSFGSAPVVQTNDIDEARELLGRAYLPLELNPTGCCPLDLQMSAADLGVLTARATFSLAAR
jgi:hypothetical protein